MNTTWISQADQLRTFCRQIDGDAVAVDTESDHFHAYQAQVCLIQVATAESSALIDPLALDAQALAPLFDILEDPDVSIIMHAGRNDIIELDRDYEVDIVNVFDTQIAARFLGYERNSLSWLLEEIVGVEPGGQYQRFDWTTRPIPDEARHYAAEDVHHLLALRERFTGELADSGWLEAFDQQCAFVEATAEHVPKPFDPEGWRSLKGADKLDGRGRAALKELYLWRHELCTRLNRSAVTIFQNGALLRLAKKRPTSADELARVGRVPRTIVEDHAQEVAAVIEKSLQAPVPVAELPRPPYNPPPAEEDAIYNALRRWRNDKADELDIPSPFIATNATVREIAQNPPRTTDELANFEAVLDWHRKTLGEEMLQIIARAH